MDWGRLIEQEFEYHRRMMMQQIHGKMSIPRGYLGNIPLGTPGNVKYYIPSNTSPNSASGHYDWNGNWIEEGTADLPHEIPDSPKFTYFTLDKFDNQNQDFYKLVKQFDDLVEEFGGLG